MNQNLTGSLGLFTTVFQLAHLTNMAAGANGGGDNIGPVYDYIQAPSVSLVDSQMLFRDDDCNPNNDTILEAILASIFNANYNRNTVPSKNGSTFVAIEFVIQSISQVSEISSSFTMDLLFSQIWEDRRLRFDHLTGKCLQNLTLGHKTVNKIWTPEFTKIHDSPTPNVFLMIYPNGTVWVIGPCDMNLELFPLDVQVCELVIESYAYNTAKVSLNWRDWNPVFSIAKSKLADFTLYGIQWTKNRFEYAAGQWDQLTVSLTFSRAYGFYILQMYIPTYASCCLSFISFWIDFKSLPARISLGYGNIAKSLPKVGYVKSADIYYSIVTSFIFLTLIEIAIVCYVENKLTKLKKKKEIERKSKRINEIRKISSKNGSNYNSYGAFLSSSLHDNNNNDSSSSRNNSLSTLAETTETEQLNELVQRENAERPFKSHAYPSFKKKTVFNKRNRSIINLNNEWSMQALTAFSFGFGVDIDLEVPPRWTGERIDSISRKLFPGAFVLFNTVYWIYYLTQNHYAKAQALNGLA